VQLRIEKQKNPRQK